MSEQIEFEQLDEIFDKYFPHGTVEPKNEADHGNAEMMTKFLEYRRNNFKQALTTLMAQREAAAVEKTVKAAYIDQDEIYFRLPNGFIEQYAYIKRLAALTSRRKEKTK